MTSSAPKRGSSVWSVTDPYAGASNDEPRFGSVKDGEEAVAVLKICWFDLAARKARFVVPPRKLYL